ncbi:MAG: chemotaxis protein [Rhodospirillaceae bacterium]|jgi:hypothetical protein|nr:chemotaxis protein [Rhodospirillaceae bacterium]
MTDFLIATVVIACLLMSWIGVQRIVFRFAKNHPEFGPPREEGSGCGSCSTKNRCHTAC